MQFLTSLFGGSGDTLLISILVLGVILGLAGLGAWTLRLAPKAPATVGRGRNRRLSVVDHMQIDARRQLLIVRRDDSEYLILTGGPQDLVVDSRIAVERPATAPRRAAEAVASAAPPRAAGDDMPPPAAARPHMDKLREFTRAAPQRTSMRHTGLMRPVSRMETTVLPMPPIAEDSSAAITAIDTRKPGIGRSLGDPMKAGNS